MKGGYPGQVVIPPLRENEDAPLEDLNKEKARILAGKFFPNGSAADLSDIQEAR